MLLGQERERDDCYREIILLFWNFTFGVDSISEEVVGFSPFMVSPRKKNVFIVLCLIAVLVILSVKYPNIILS